MKRHTLLAALAAFCFCTGFIKPISVNLEDLPKVDRWAATSENARQKKIKALKDPLAKAAVAASLESWETCVNEARQVPVKSIVRDWALLTEVECARQLAEEDPKTKTKNIGAMLNESIHHLETSNFDGLTKAANERKNLAILNATMSLLKWSDKHGQWKDLRAALTRAFRLENFFSRQDRAQIYYYAGNLLVSDRQWADAFLHFARAHDLNPDAGNIDSRVKSVLPMLPGNLREQFEKTLSKNAPEPTPAPLNPSTEELELYNQAEGYVVRNDPVDAVEAMGKLIKKYPGGMKAKWAQDKIFELFLQELDRSKGPNGVSVAKKRILNTMLDLDAERQGEWAGALFSMQAYDDAAELYKKAALLGSGSAKASKLFYMAGRSYQLGGDSSNAKEMYSILVKSYPAAAEVTDGAIQWALVNINEGDPSEAISHLEIARSRKMTNQQDLVSLFWLYESYKTRNSESGISETSNELLRRFGLTYYGIIAYYDMKKQIPSFEKSKVKTGKVYFSDSETNALERAKALLASGLLDAASDELAVFGTRPLNTAEEQYLANFFGQALKYPKTFNLLTNVIDEAPERRDDFVVHQIFPKEFWDVVSDDKRRSDLDPFLLLSVMKQESAFDPSAVSHSGALGLLQMIPPTAIEMKQELGSDADIPKDLADPATNVRFCAYYLSKLIKKFGGSIPLALAAYNAGPTRISQFMNAKPNGLKDTWVDELPWAETSYYVKSILKNYVMYRVLYGGMTQLPSPPWSK